MTKRRHMGLLMGALFALVAGGCGAFQPEAGGQTGSSPLCAVIMPCPCVHLAHRSMARAVVGPDGAFEGRERLVGPWPPSTLGPGAGAGAEAIVLSPDVPADVGLCGWAQPMLQPGQEVLLIGGPSTTRAIPWDGHVLAEGPGGGDFEITAAMALASADAPRCAELFDVPETTPCNDLVTVVHDDGCSAAQPGKRHPATRLGPSGVVLLCLWVLRRRRQVRVWP